MVQVSIRKSNKAIEGLKLERLNLEYILTNRIEWLESYDDFDIVLEYCKSYRNEKVNKTFTFKKQDHTEDANHIVTEQIQL